MVQKDVGGRGEKRFLAYSFLAAAAGAGFYVQEFQVMLPRRTRLAKGAAVGWP